MILAQTQILKQRSFRKLMETTDVQHRKEIESMNQIQAHIQEIKNSAGSIYSWLNQGENRISDLEDRTVVRKHKKKDFSNRD